MRNVKHIPGSWNLFSEMQYLKELEAKHDGWYLKRKYMKAQYKNDQLKTVGPKPVKSDTRDAQFMIFRRPQNGIVMAIQESPEMTKSQWWHERLGHMSIRKIRDSVRLGAITGIPLEDLIDEFQCVTCDMAKMVRKPYPRQELTNEYARGERWLIDIAKGGDKCATDKSEYILVTKDDATGFKVLYYLRTKDQAVACILAHIERLLTNHHTLVRALKTDRGTENVNKIVKEACEMRGIEHHLSPPYQPQCNSVVERENRTNQEGIRALLTSAGLSERYWKEAAEFHTHVHNLMINRRSTPKSAYEAFWNKKPKDINYIMPFGANVIYLDEQVTGKNKNRGKLGKFMGFSRFTTKVYKVLIKTSATGGAIKET